MGSVGPERSFVEFETFAHRLQGSSFHLGVSFDKLGVYHQQVYGPNKKEKVINQNDKRPFEVLQAYLRS